MLMLSALPLGVTNCQYAKKKDLKGAEESGQQVWVPNYMCMAHNNNNNKI